MRVLGLVCNHYSDAVAVLYWLLLVSHYARKIVAQLGRLILKCNLLIVFKLYERIAKTFE